MHRAQNRCVSLKPGRRIHNKLLVTPTKNGNFQKRIDYVAIITPKTEKVNRFFKYFSKTGKIFQKTIYISFQIWYDAVERKEFALWTITIWKESKKPRPIRK